MKTKTERLQTNTMRWADPGVFAWSLLVAFFVCGAFCAKADDTSKGEAPIKPEVPVKVVFLYMGGAEPAERPNNTKIVGWKKGLTAQGAIIAAGGFPIPPWPKVKVVRGTTEIPVDLRALRRGVKDVPLEPADKVLLYLGDSKIQF